MGEGGGWCVRVCCFSSVEVGGPCKWMMLSELAMLEAGGAPAALLALPAQGELVTILWHELDLLPQDCRMGHLWLITENRRETYRFSGLGL